MAIRTIWNLPDLANGIEDGHHNSSHAVVEFVRGPKDLYDALLDAFTIRWIKRRHVSVKIALESVTVLNRVG